MPPQLYVSRLEDYTVLNDKYVQMAFELVEPNHLEFFPGQYISIKVDASGTRRSYSISSSADITHGFELLIDTAPQGLGTKYLTSLAVGDQMPFIGPMGRFVLMDENEPAVYLIATGSGIAPFFSMAQQLLQVQKTTKEIHLYWGMRHAHHLFWLDTFAEWEDTFPNFHFHPVLSQPIPEWTLSRGRVTDVLNAQELPQEAGYYLCGNAAMIAQMMQILEKKRVAPVNIHYEKFY
jgi:ferredoxin-NADP reductase